MNITLSYESIRKAAQTSSEVKAALRILAPNAFGITLKSLYSDEGRAFIKAAEAIGLPGVEVRCGGEYDEAGVYLPSHLNGERVKWSVVSEGGTSILVPEFVR